MKSIALKSLGVYRSATGFYPAKIQIESIEKTVEKNRLELVGINDLTLLKLKRGSDLVNELVKEKIDCLIVWRLDCFAPLFKSMEDVVVLLAELSDQNITFISIEDKIDSDDPASTVLPNLFQAWVELKKNRRIENARRSSQKAQESGKIRNTGRKRVRNDSLIHELRGKGLSIRDISYKVGVSTTSVHRSLKNSPEYQQQSISTLDKSLDC